MFKKLSSAMGKSSSFHSERKPPAPPPPQASPPGGSSDSDNFDSASSSADSLEGSVELTIVLPNGKTVFMSVEKRMPMMDLLIHVATSNKISPGSHVINVFNDSSKDAVTYTPSTPIGMLNTSVIYIVPKKNSENVMKKPARMSSTQPFEHTFRLQVHLPRNQLLVLRVSQQIRLSDLHEMVCVQKGLDATRYALQHPLDPDIPLDYACSLADYNLTEINFMSKRSTVVPSYNSSPNEFLDIGRDSTDEKKRKTVFGFVFRRSKSSLGDSSSDDRSSRGVSPTRSDGSGHQSLSPPLSSPPSSTLGVVKKRPAPLPPTALQKQRGEKPPPPPPFRSKSATISNSELEHTRTKSDSSVSLDRASLGDSTERYDVPVVSKKASTKIGAASSLSNLSTTSSTTSGVKKRRAPPPPMNILSVTSVVAADCHQQPSDNGKVSPSATISVIEDTVSFGQSTDMSHKNVDNVHKPVLKSLSTEHKGDHHNSSNRDNAKPITTVVQHHKGEVVKQEITEIVQPPNSNNVVEQFKPKEQTESKHAERISALAQQMESNSMQMVNVREEHPVHNCMQMISAEAQQLESNYSEKISAQQLQLESFPVEVIFAKEQQSESDPLEKISCKEQHPESNSMESISAKQQQLELKRMKEIPAADERSMSNRMETSTAPEQLNRIGKSSGTDLQCRDNQIQYEQDEAISMVHEVFQDIDQEYSDQEEDESISKIVENSEVAVMPHNYLDCKEVHSDKEDKNANVDYTSDHFECRGELSIPEKDHLDSSNQNVSTDLKLKTEAETLVTRHLTDLETAIDGYSESSCEASSAPSSQSSIIQPTVPSPTLPLSSVASSSVSLVPHHDCPEHLENSFKLPVNCHPAPFFPSTETPQNFDDNDFLPDQLKIPTSDVFTHPVVNKSTLGEELPSPSTSGSTLYKPSADLPTLPNKMVPSHDCKKIGHVGDQLPVDTVPDCNSHHVDNEVLNSQLEWKIQTNFLDPTSEINFSLPDHHERAIQTSPVPDLQQFVLQQNIIARQNALSTDGSNPDQLINEKSANPCPPTPQSSSIIHNTTASKSVVQPKLGRVAASFPDDRRQQYQWNDVLIGDSMPSASVDDDWVSSCSEGETEVTDACPRVTNSNKVVIANPNNSAMPAFTKGRTDQREVKRLSDYSSCSQIGDYGEVTDVMNQKDLLAAKGSDNFDLGSSSEAKICDLSPVLVSHEVKERLVVCEVRQEVTSMPTKSKANTLPHNATKVADNDAGESNLAAKAATLPLNATRGSYPSESCPPTVPKFKRPLMNFSISTYKSRTEVDPAYETRLVKSESFSTQPVLQQARGVTGRCIGSRGSSFQNKSEDRKQQFMVSEADSDPEHNIRQRSSTLPVNQQSTLMMNSSTTNFDMKASMGKSSSMTHLGDCDEAHIFRTQSVQNLECKLGSNNSSIPQPTEREEVLVLQQEYWKLQKQLLHWQQQLLSNQNLLQKQHILPEDAFQLSPDMLLLKGSEESVKPISFSDNHEPQFVEPKHGNEQDQVVASSGAQKSHSTGAYMKLQMCQPYKAKPDVHGKVKPLKQKPNDVNTDASDAIIRTKTVSIKSSHEQQFSEEVTKSSVIPNSQTKFTNQTSNVVNSAAPPRLNVLQSKDIMEVTLTSSQDVTPMAYHTSNTSKPVPLLKPNTEPAEEADLEVNLPSVKDRVSMLFGKSSSKLHHSHNPVTRPVVGYVVEKNSVRSHGKALKTESNPLALNTEDIVQTPYVESELPSRVLYNSFPVMSNVVGRRSVSAESDTQSDLDQERVSSEVSATTKNKFRRQRFEPAMLRDENSDNGDNGISQVNGTSKNVAKEVQFSINSSTDQQRREWEAPTKCNKSKTLSASASKSRMQVDSRAQGNSQHNGEKKNVTKVAINGGCTIVDQSSLPVPASKFIPTSQKPRSAPFSMEIELGKNSTAKSALTAKKIPVKPVQQDPRNMLLDQIKNFGGRENLRDSRHRE